MHACNKDVVKLILDCPFRNIDLNARSRSGWTAFMKACSYGRTEVVKLILDHPNRNIDLNTRDGNGWTALMLAYRYGCNDVATLIVDYSTERNIDLK